MMANVATTHLRWAIADRICPAALQRWRDCARRALASPWWRLGASLARRSDLLGHRQQVVAGHRAGHVGVNLLDVSIGLLHELILGVASRHVAAVAADHVGHRSPPF